MFWPFKKREAKLQHIQVVTVKPGDVLVVKSEEEIHPENMQRVLAVLERQLGFKPAIIWLANDAELSILRSSTSA